MKFSPFNVEDENNKKKILLNWKYFIHFLIILSAHNKYSTYRYYSVNFMYFVMNYSHDDMYEYNLSNQSKWYENKVHKSI